jgi:D-amino peptidase
MDHTYGGRTVYALRINGRAQSEATLNAALAGSFGVRTGLITGDQATIDEAAGELPGIEGVVVKETLSRQAARSLHPAEARRRIEAGAYHAYAEQAGRPLYQPKGPFTLEIDWMNANMADLCVQLPQVERAGGRTVRYRSPDFQTCYRMLLALLIMATPAAYQYPRP